VVSELVVWMCGEAIGVLSGRRGALVFEYSQAALDGGIGRPLLSVSMPTAARPYRGAVPHAFFDGLLPEGEARRIIAFDFGIDGQDVFGLLAALGRDCAGAVSLLPEGEELEQAGAAQPITDAEIAERLRGLRFHPLGVDRRVRVSLAGVQEKLLLARAGDRWGLPVDGAPSTHILKPAHPLLADAIANEALCLRAASHLGISAAEVEVGNFAGLPALVVGRYDRVEAGDGWRRRVVRVHQEDFCQAHGIATDRKYEERGGPSLRRCAELLRRWARADQLDRLLDITFLNVVVGNADAHAKNLALLHTSGGQVGLAPVYDVMSTTYYPNVSRIAGMAVDGVRHIDEITRAGLIEEAAAWGVRRPAAAARVDRLLEGAEQAIDRAAAEVGAPEQLTAALLRRAEALRSS
jgi:serine/threonine-protein kinase HipA